MDIKDTVLNLLSSEVYIPKEDLQVDRTLADCGASNDLTEIKYKLDSRYHMNIPMNVINGKISGIISCIEKKNQLH